MAKKKKSERSVLEDKLPEHEKTTEGQFRTETEYDRQYDLPTWEESPNVPRDLMIYGNQVDKDVSALDTRVSNNSGAINQNEKDIETNATNITNHRTEEGKEEMGGSGNPTHHVSTGITNATLKKHPHSHDGRYSAPHGHPYASDTHDHTGVYAPAAHGHGEFGNYVPLSGTWSMHGDIASNGGFGVITNNGNPIVGFKKDTSAGMTYMEGCYQGWYNRLVFKWQGADGSINSGTWIYAGSFNGGAYYKSDLDAKVKDKADQTKAVDVSKVDVTKLDVHETLSFDIDSLKAAGIPVETHEYKYSHEDNPTKTLPEVEQTEHSYSVNQVLAAAVLHIKKLEERVAELEK